jgi:Uma2 family endonuclease
MLQTWRFAKGGAGIMYKDYDKPSMELNENSPYGTSAEKHTQGTYTVDDYRTLPDDQRVELIDGYFFYMEAPSLVHQRIAGEIHRQIANFIREKHGNCIPFISPIDVQLDCDEHTMVQPDVSILCHEERMTRQCIFGAPDFVLEIISPSTKRKDSIKKLAKYENAGVREYWILDPYEKRILVYFFENEICPAIYGFDKPVPINIYNGELEIDLTEIVQWVQE